MKSLKKVLPAVLILAAAAILTGIGAADLQAATRTWNGGGTTDNWNDAANWGGTAPVANDLLVFGGTARQTNNNNLTGLPGTYTGTYGIVFNTAGWTLGGNQLLINSTGNLMFNYNAAGSYTIHNAINVGTANATRYSNAVSGANVTLDGLLSGSSLGNSFRFCGDGSSLTLSNNNNSFASDVIAEGATIAFTSLANKGVNCAVGTGNGMQFRVAGHTASPGVFSYLGDPTNGFTNAATDRNLVFREIPGATVAIENNSAGYNLTWNLPTTTLWIKDSGAAAGTFTFRLGGTSTGQNAFYAPITNCTDQTGLLTALTIDTAGTWALHGVNTYTGATTVANGTLLVNSSLASGSAVAVNGGTLGGTGTIGGPVTVGAATFAPGASAGTLTINNSLILAANSILGFELNGGDTSVGSGINDLVTGVTNFTLDGTLNVAELASFASARAGDTWRLFDYTGVLTDNGVSLGSMPTLSNGLSFAIDTGTSGQVNLTVVPEPGALALLVAGLLGLLAYAWRKRK